MRGARTIVALALLASLLVAVALCSAVHEPKTSSRELLSEAVSCTKSSKQELGRRFPSIIPAKETHCYSFNSEDMISFGTVKVMLSSHSALEILVSLGDESATWNPAQLNKADQNLQELEANVKPGDINLHNNRTLRVAVRNVDQIAVPFSMVALLPLPVCEYEPVNYFDQDYSVR